MHKDSRKRKGPLTDTRKLENAVLQLQIIAFFQQPWSLEETLCSRKKQIPVSSLFASLEDVKWRTQLNSGQAPG